MAASQQPGRLGKMPLVVIARAKTADEDSDWIKVQRKLLEWSSASKLVLSVGSSHDIEVDDPGVIVAAIQSTLLRAVAANTEPMSADVPARPTSGHVTVSGFTIHR